LIYVRRDPAAIPERLLRVAERAQQELEQKLPEDRKSYIEKKGHIWRAFGKYLSAMSHHKCWYSESKDPQSFFDVDHFRPKSKAIRSDESNDEGYPWLAFSWENFRYSAGRSNRQNKDENTEETVGKGCHFPLLAESQIATWENRWIHLEQPLLLDPTIREDVGLITVNSESGRIEPSIACRGPVKREKVTRSIEIYGLNLPRLMDARKEILRRIDSAYQTLVELLEEDIDRRGIHIQTELLREATCSRAVYSLAARSKLRSLPFGAEFLATPED